MNYLRLIIPIFSLFIAIIVLTNALAAQDENTLANDPFINPDANACFAGGSWEGKCGDDLEMWRAGWYLIRWEKRIIATDEMPDQYKWVTPGDGSSGGNGPVATEEA
jgi:hypothetical protein